jgi:hypothetical protein
MRWGEEIRWREEGNKGREKKKKEKRKEKGYYGYFTRFNNGEKLFCQTVPKNSFCSTSEVVPRVKPQLKVFWLEPEPYQTGSELVHHLMKQGLRRNLEFVQRVVAKPSI